MATPLAVTSWLKGLTEMPEVTLPESRWLDLPGRGRTWLTDVAGPPGAPAIVLLHSLACTGLLTWYPFIERLSQTHRVVTFDQRSHGRGITTDSFALSDCADDTAAVVAELGLDRPIFAGYSMGGVIAQRMWRQHPDLVGGLILAATTDHFRASRMEQIFFGAADKSGMTRLKRRARARVADSARIRVERTDATDDFDTGRWALAQFNSTSPWAIAQAMNALGRHHSTPWLRQIQAPTAVVVTARDKAIPAARQRALARRIPASTIHEADCGHAGCVLRAGRFASAFHEAVRVVTARRKANLGPTAA